MMAKMAHPAMARKPLHNRRPDAIFHRLPLEDMRELWYWGVWKEPLPAGFSTSVVVVCTSREKCLIYSGIQTHDHFLLDDESPESTKPGDQPFLLSSDQTPRSLAKARHAEGNEDLFDDGNPKRSASGRRFRMVSFAQLLDELHVQVGRHSEITLIVNPRHSSSRVVTADAMWRAEAFLREHGAAVPARPRGRT
jgi:hypothetical protein